LEAVSGGLESFGGLLQATRPRRHSGRRQRRGCDDDSL